MTMRKYAIELPVYDVFDSDTGEILSRGIDMKEIVRRHSAIIEHLSIRRIYGGFKSY